MRLLIKSLLTLLLFPSLCLGAVAFDTACNGTALAATSLTFSCTTAAGSDRLIIVGAAQEVASPSIAVSGITYNGVALTSVADVEFDNTVTVNRLQMYSLVANAAGANNVVISYGGTVSTIGGAAFTFTGVDQTTPLGTAGTNNGDAGEPSTINVTGVANGMVMDLINHGNNQDMTYTGGQTERLDEDIGPGTLELAGSTSVDTGTVAMSVGWASDNRYAHIAVPILPATAATLRRHRVMVLQ